MSAFFDMHCHLGFSSNAPQAVQALALAGAGAYCVCVTPEEYQRLATKFDDWAPHVRVGVGLHPWWVSDGRAGLDAIESAAGLARDAAYVGEVGLDFSAAHVASRSVQEAAFYQVARSCADGQHPGGAPRLLSLHAVHAADAVLDILEASGAIEECTCVFHWYSDTPEALQRAIKHGCLFSLGLRSLSTRRGREYARQIPAHQLLLETDEPAEGAPYEVQATQDQLAQACALLEQIKGQPLAELLAQSSRALLGV